MSKTISLRARLAASVAALALMPAIAWAQTKSSPADEAIPARLEEVVVTARRQSENLQKTPLAISAFTEQAIAARGATNIADLSMATPGLVFQAGAGTSGNPNTAAVFLRGVGQLDFTMFSDPGVGVYLDGVYIARSTGSVLELQDVKRVEIIRGPQGTLFGRNTIGGALSIISKPPASEFGGVAKVTLGSYGRRDFQATVDAPLTNNLLSKVSLLTRQVEGYGRELQTGRRLGDQDTLTGRVQLMWRPTADLTINLTGDGTRQRSNTAPYTLLSLEGFGLNPTTGRGYSAPQANPISVYNRSLGGVCATDPNSSRSCLGQAWRTGDTYTNNDTFAHGVSQDVAGVSATVEYNTAIGALKSISAYRRVTASYGRDIDHTPMRAFSIAYDDRQRQYSQEVQLTGKALDDQLRYVFGLYGFRETGTEVYEVLNAVAFRSLNDVKIANRSYAVFSELTYDIRPWLHVTGGLRASKESKRFSVFSRVVEQFASPPIFSGAPVGTLIVQDPSQKSLSFSSTTPRLILSADVSSQLMAYASYSEGFKSGGFNGRYSVVVPAPIPFNPEKLNQTEIGMKYSSSNFRGNVAIFRSEYDDIQVNFKPATALPLSYVGNAAKGRIDGVEAELTLLPVTGLLLTASGSYLDARYTSNAVGVVGITPDTPFADTPKFSAAASIAYDLPISGDYGATVRIDYSYRSKVALDSVNSILLRQNAYSLFNASLVVHAPSDWEAQLGISNLTDKRYLITGSFTAGTGVADGTFAPPRQAYISLQKRF